MVKIAINGFGRIGRSFFKLALVNPALEIVAINDLENPESLNYFLEHDSVYGKYDKETSIAEEGGKKFLKVDGKSILFLQEKDPDNLPWKDLGVDIVVEATGVFDSYGKARVHIDAGAKRVVLSAPSKDADGPDASTVLMGINEEKLNTRTLSSNGSCTTNSASPIIQILNDKIGIKKAFLETVHAYTASQELIDAPPHGGMDVRRGREAGVNIIPSTTEAVGAVARTMDFLRDKFDGMSMRVPVPVGSVSAIVFVAGRTTTMEEINSILTEAGNDARWQGIFKVTTEPTVSTDIIGDPCPSIADLSLTKVIDGDLCAVYSWYDNEFGYASSLIRHVIKVAERF